MKFLCYTNDGGQTEAVFCVDHPPRGLLGDGLWGLSYESPTGWARGSAPTRSFGFYGWDGTGSIAVVTVETTNVAARVVVSLYTRRKNFYGVYDRLLELLAKMQHKRPALRADVTLLTNQTVVTRP